MFKLAFLSHRRLFTFFIFFLYSLQAHSKTIVISDIDDTLKKANSMGKAAELTYHFLRKLPYLEMRDLMNEIKERELSKHESIRYYYVSAAYEATFEAGEWLQKYHFPLGKSVLKAFKNKESTYDFKHAVIKKILQAEMQSLKPKENEVLHVLMFGDNAQADAVVYSDLTKELNLDSKIYIRDVRAEATFFDSTLMIKKMPGVNYYFSEVELLANPEFDYVSADLRMKTFKSYKERTLVPEYTLRTLDRRLQDLYHDKARAKSDSIKYWNDYYSRF
ncbi:MAG: phosphatase domain-containing protein [Bacteriovorax sp.]